VPAASKDAPDSALPSTQTRAQTPCSEPGQRRRSELVLSTQGDTKTDATQRALAICLTAYSFSATCYKSACVHSEREKCARVRT
jgi:hypothetical protein